MPPKASLPPVEARPPAPMNIPVPAPPPLAIAPVEHPIPPPPPATAAPPAPSGVGGFVGARRASSAEAAAAARSSDKTEDEAEAQAPASGAPPPPADLGARLRAAAAAGRRDEVRALLDQGAPVDAADADGETALMIAVRSDQPAAAALLRRAGASLERRNRSGRSARDMAASMDDPTLDRALGLAP